MRSTHGPVALTAARKRAAYDEALAGPTLEHRAGSSLADELERHGAPGVIGDDRASPGSRGHRGERQAAVVRRGLVKEEARLRQVAAQVRGERARLVTTEEAARRVAEARQRGVQAGAEGDTPAAHPLGHRDHQRERGHHLRRDAPLERPPLRERRANEAQLAGGEVAEPAVDELRGGAGRGAAEVAGIHERDAQAGAGGFVGDPAAHDAGADHEHVERPRAQGLERIGSASEGQGLFSSRASVWVQRGVRRLGEPPPPAPARPGYTSKNNMPAFSLRAWCSWSSGRSGGAGTTPIEVVPARGVEARAPERGDERLRISRDDREHPVRPPLGAGPGTRQARREESGELLSRPASARRSSGGSPRGACAPIVARSGADGRARSRSKRSPSAPGNPRTEPATSRSRSTSRASAP